MVSIVSCTLSFDYAASTDISCSPNQEDAARRWRLMRRLFLLSMQRRCGVGPVAPQSKQKEAYARQGAREHHVQWNPTPPASLHPGGLVVERLMH